MLVFAIRKCFKSACFLGFRGALSLSLALSAATFATAQERPASEGVRFADDAAMADKDVGTRQAGGRNNGAAPADALIPVAASDAADTSGAPRPLTSADGTALPVPIHSNQVDANQQPAQPASTAPAAPSTPAAMPANPPATLPTLSIPAATPTPITTTDPSPALPTPGSSASMLQTPQSATSPTASAVPPTQSTPSTPTTQAASAVPNGVPTPAANIQPGKTLEPIAEDKFAGPADIEVTAFHGITPGMTTRAEVEKAWGKPKESRTQGVTRTDLYTVDPFPRVEVNSTDGKVSSLIIRFEHGYPAGQVAEQLDLLKVQAVLVSNDLGTILGQAYPERGVLFAFEQAEDPSKALKKVTHIILEPITAEPFVLRSETNLDTRPEFSLHDAEQAIKLQSNLARAHWLRSRSLTYLGQYAAAAQAAADSVRLDPKDARYQLTKAQTLAQQGAANEAMAEVEKAIALSGSRPHVRAKAICLMGDLNGAAKKPDYRQAFKLHSQSIQMAVQLAPSKHPAIRLAAKEALLDAHLGAGRDIAWGEWREKDKAVINWLDKAGTIAEDLIKNEHGGEEYRFRVNVRALGVVLGLQGKLDPSRWSKETVRSGEDLIASSPEMARKSQVEWEIAVALYDALQIFQMRNDQENTLQCGEQAISYLTRSGRQGQAGSATYLLGRIYFRMGAVYALNREDHKGAVEWFEKAVPMLGKAPPPEAMSDLARLGDTFVSMGVSYWKSGYHKKALALTQHGANLMEEAVRRGTHDRDVLLVPYSNLAAMQREMGNTQDATRMEQMASRIKDTTMK
jgi:tetratricopeptide (TPR) repeat protein